MALFLGRRNENSFYLEVIVNTVNVESVMSLIIILLYSSHNLA